MSQDINYAGRQCPHQVQKSKAYFVYFFGPWVLTHLWFGQSDGPGLDFEWGLSPREAGTLTHSSWLWQQHPAQRQPQQPPLTHVDGSSASTVPGSGVVADVCSSAWLCMQRPSVNYPMYSCNKYVCYLNRLAILCYLKLKNVMRITYKEQTLW